MTTNRRELVVQRVQRRLIRESFPRLQMALLVALTGGFGLLASFTLLRLGLDSMALRYPLALTFAYLFFLYLIWLWLRANTDDYCDAPDILDLMPRSGESGGPPGIASGGGGQFGGGGATASYDGSAATVDEAGSSSFGDVGEAVGSAAEAGEFAIPAVAIALAAGIAVASLYVVYIAPVLFAEVLVDGALSYALFRHLRGQEQRHWLASAFARTVWPFTATAVLLVAVGAAMTAYAPGARSVAQVVKHASAQRATK